MVSSRVWLKQHKIRISQNCSSRWANCTTFSKSPPIHSPSRFGAYWIWTWSESPRLWSRGNKGVTIGGVSDWRAQLYFKLFKARLQLELGLARIGIETLRHLQCNGPRPNPSWSRSISPPYSRRVDDDRLQESPLALNLFYNYREKNLPHYGGSVSRPLRQRNHF